MQTVPPVARERLFNMRMSAEESTRLEYLAEHYGLNAAGVLRMLVKGDFDRLHRETQAPAAPAPKPRKR